MSKLWFTSDHHFGDTRLSLFPRPAETAEEIAEVIISNHNKLVGRNDVVYFLGDVATKLEALPLVGRMHGVKILIKGNYDTFDNKEYKKYFDGVATSENVYLTKPNADGTNLRYQDIVKGENYLDLHLVHYPSKGDVDKFNLVGHIHGAWRVQKNMLNVGLDVWNYKPYSEEDIWFMYTAINKFYDEDCWAAYNEANTLHMGRGKKGAAAAGSLVEKK